jgi:hypothetical protein
MAGSANPEAVLEEELDCSRLFDSRKDRIGVPRRLHVNTDLNIPIELPNDRDHTVERETVELRVPDPREVGTRDACQLLGCTGAELSAIKHVNDLGSEDRARLLEVGIQTSSPICTA